MAAKTGVIDRALRLRLEKYRKEDRNHWAFQGNAVRKHGHAYFQYPAMMVPQMVGDLLTSVKRDTESCDVYDPFMGSGTVLTEAMSHGMNFTGQDINPLAVLLCQAKSIPFFHDAMSEKVTQVISRASSDKKRNIEAHFPNRKKWFLDGVSIELSRIHRAIRREPELWARRFLWIALAETVRLSSNSRTSTFKLHIRPKAEIKKRQDISPLEIFSRTTKRNVEELGAQKSTLDEASLLRSGHYIGDIKVRIANSCNKMRSHPDKGFDVLVTSPPYGDNPSTVPYGQHSYLPLQWLDLSDIDSDLDSSYLATTHEIDRLSLGGSRKGVAEVEESLREESKSLSETLDRLKEAPPDRAKRVLAFCRDLRKCIEPIMSVMRPDAVMMWILGNRRVGGKPVPLDRILSEFLIAHGARSILMIKRDIPSKRMAYRNSVATTMKSETIVVLRKGEI